MADAVIRVEGVSKSFKLPHEKQSSIKGLFVNLFKGRKSYEKQRVLKNISFDIEEGDFFGIVGRNGSGKSTLLKLLAGIYVPDKGEIHVRGKLTPFIELGVGFNPELTGRENVFLNGALLGFDRAEMEAMYDDIVAFAELKKFMDQKLKNYSSGMQVRLAFSIAIRAQTEILLLDEVLAVGDAAFQSKCINYFNRLKAEGKTVVFVSHDMSSVERFCDKVLVVDHGNIDGLYDARSGVRRYEDFNLKSEVKDLDRELKKDASVDKHIILETGLQSSTGGAIVPYKGTLIGTICIDNKRLLQQYPDTRRFSCSATFFNKDSVLISTIETQANHYSVEDNSITFTINNIVFTPGIYTAYFGLYSTDDKNKAICLEVTAEAVGFGVESNGRATTDGIMQLEVDWSDATKSKLVKDQTKKGANG